MLSTFSRACCVLALLAGFSSTLSAQAKPDCSQLPDHNRLRSVLQSIVKEGQQGNGGLGNQEWAVVINRDGIG